MIRHGAAAASIHAPIANLGFPATGSHRTLSIEARRSMRDNQARTDRRASARSHQAVVHPPIRVEYVIGLPPIIFLTNVNRRMCQ